MVKLVVMTSQVARVVCSSSIVELRSRVVWFEAHLLKLRPIGPICRYVPFRTARECKDRFRENPVDGVVRFSLKRVIRINRGRV